MKFLLRYIYIHIYIWLREFSYNESKIVAKKYIGSETFQHVKTPISKQKKAIFSKQATRNDTVCYNTVRKYIIYMNVCLKMHSAEISLL